MTDDGAFIDGFRDRSFCGLLWPGRFRIPLASLRLRGGLRLLRLWSLRLRRLSLLLLSLLRQSKMGLREIVWGAFNLLRLRLELLMRQ